MLGLLHSEHPIREQQPHARRQRLATGMLHLRAADRLVARLDRANIPCTLLKGAAFLDTLYVDVDVAERSLGDVDILVPRSARWQLPTLLREIGAHPLDAEPDHSFHQQFKAAEGVCLEVHDGLCTPGLFRIDHDALLRRRVIRKSGGRAIPMLDPEDSFLSLVVHEAKHGYGVPEHSRDDLERIVERWQPHWPVVVERARAWGAGIACYVSCLGLRHRGAAIPTAVLDTLRPSAARLRLLGSAINLATGRPTWRVDRRTVRSLVVCLSTDHPSQTQALASEAMSRQWAHWSRLLQRERRLSTGELLRPRR